MNAFKTTLGILLGVSILSAITAYAAPTPLTGLEPLGEVNAANAGALLGLEPLAASATSASGCSAANGTVVGVGGIASGTDGKGGACGSYVCVASKNPGGGGHWSCKPGADCNGCSEPH